MQDENYESAKNVSSFGLESLLWNIPNEIFTKYSIYRYAFGEVVEYAYKNIAALSSFKEANGIKALCPSPVEIENFTTFIKDLNNFYEYDV